MHVDISRKLDGQQSRVAICNLQSLIEFTHRWIILIILISTVFLNETL